MEGFDYMTIAEWVGHVDGGVLIGKLYGHLRQGHKQECARRFTFGHKQQDPANRTVADLSVEELLKLVKAAAAPAPSPAGT